MISDDQINTGGSGKPLFMIDALTHAREWLGGATVMNILRIVSLSLVDHRFLYVYVGL